MSQNNPALEQARAELYDALHRGDHAVAAAALAAVQVARARS